MAKKFLFTGTFLLQHVLLTHKKQRMDLPVVPLHHHPEYKKQCCRLINDEWKRSEIARLRSLDASCDTLPTCLVLLENKRVIGHCKLSAIPSIKDSCFVESVVINKDLRGRGHGTYLMQKAEQYCEEVLNLSVVYLSTKGQETFYEKLGYAMCAPVSIYGSFVPACKSPNQRHQSPVMNINVNTNGTNRKIYMCKQLKRLE